MKDFIWTDELVKNFILTESNKYNQWDSAGLDKWLDKFKKSKQPKTKEYEILERFEYSKCACDGDLSPIKSVKRLSDGEVFSVGDRLADMGEDDIIKSFWANHGGNNLWISTNDREQYGCAFDSAKKAKEVLFTTNDGKAISFMDRYYSVTDNWELMFSNATQKIDYASRTFSTKEAAEHWVLHNKPLLSLDDLLSVWGSARPKEYYSTSPLFESFKELAKSKL